MIVYSVFFWTRNKCFREFYARREDGRAHFSYQKTQPDIIRATLASHSLGLATDDIARALSQAANPDNTEPEMLCLGGALLDTWARKGEP